MKSRGFTLTVTLLTSVSWHLGRTVLFWSQQMLLTLILSRWWCRVDDYSTPTTTSGEKVLVRSRKLAGLRDYMTRGEMNSLLWFISASAGGCQKCSFRRPAAWTEMQFRVEDLCTVEGSESAGFHCNTSSFKVTAVLKSEISSCCLQIEARSFFCNISSTLNFYIYIWIRFFTILDLPLWGEVW